MQRRRLKPSEYDNFLPPVPEVIASDFGPGDADFVHLLPSEVACERVAFSARHDEMEREGYFIPLAELRTNPGKWARQLSQKKTRPGHVPALEMLADELRRRSAGRA